MRKALHLDLGALDAVCQRDEYVPGTLRQGVEHETGALVVAHLAFRQEQDDRPPVAVADSVELGV